MLKTLSNYTSLNFAGNQHSFDNFCVVYLLNLFETLKISFLHILHNSILIIF